MSNAIIEVSEDSSHMLLAEKPAPPEWVSSNTVPNPGLDLTGLRLSVQTIGNQLLDGITTVTPSVRYLSLYAWMLSSYVHAELPDSWKAFELFAEKVEAAIAVGNLLIDPAQTGIVGARAAGPLSRASTSAVDLERLVNLLAASIYLNPATQLKFLLPGAQVPGLSIERGEALSDAVRSSIAGTSLGMRFSEGELIHSAGREELRAFGKAVSLSSISELEISLLVSGIIPLEPRTEEEANRVRTYMILLGLADQLGRLPTEDDLFNEAISVVRALPSELHHHLDCWIRHLVRDVLAVGHEHLLQEALHYLGKLSLGKQMIPNVQVIRDLCSDHQSNDTALRTAGFLTATEEAKELSFAELFTRIETAVTADSVVEGGLRRWGAQLTELSLIKLIQLDLSTVVAILPVIWCLAVLRAEQWEESDQHPFEGREGFGWDLIGVSAVIIPEVRRFREEDWLLSEVMEELSLRTVEQHLRVSWSRMASDSRHDVALLVSDGDEWQSRNVKHANEFKAGRTDSRIGQAIRWLSQLLLIDKHGLTASGKKLYQDLRNHSRDVK